MEGSTEGVCSGSSAVLATESSWWWGGLIPPGTFCRLAFRPPCQPILENLSAVTVGVLLNFNEYADTRIQRVHAFSVVRGWLLSAVAAVVNVSSLSVRLPIRWRPQPSASVGDQNPVVVNALCQDD